MAAAQAAENHGDELRGSVLTDNSEIVLKYLLRSNCSFFFLFFFFFKVECRSVALKALKLNRPETWYYLNKNLVSI